ncbi:hypothetical protein [Methanolobus sp. WCC4]|uniref:hypothetical protein n=1 Tax=Methanolobus sp. WCC4 TaxID=3125784 RepID=UPI0030FC8867
MTDKKKSEGKIDRQEKFLLGVFIVAVLLELAADSTVANVPIVGDMANLLGDSVLNSVELLIAGKFALEN